MNWDAIGALGEIAGAVAVVVTLLYMSKQIREHSRHLKLTSTTDSWQVISDAFAPVYNNEQTMKVWIVGMKRPNELDEDELDIFLLLATRLMAAFDNIAELHSLGVMKEERFRNYSDFAKSFLSSPGGKLWSEKTEFQLSSAMTEVLESAA